MTDHIMHWFAMFEAPKEDGDVVIIRSTSGVYLCYWGEIDGQWGWCDVDGGFSCDDDNCLGWLPAPAIEKIRAQAKSDAVYAEKLK